MKLHLNSCACRVSACTDSCIATVTWLTLKDGGGSICEKIRVIQACLLQSLLLFCSVSHFSWTTAGGPAGYYKNANKAYCFFHCVPGGGYAHTKKLNRYMNRIPTYWTLRCHTPKCLWFVCVQLAPVHHAVAGFLQSYWRQERSREH